MAASELEIEIEQGATYQLMLTLKDSLAAPLDLTGWTFRGQIRKTYSSSTVVASFTFALNIPATDGVVNISIPATDTAAIAVDAAKGSGRTSTLYIYDMEAIKADGTVLRLLEGRASVSPEITR